MNIDNIIKKIEEESSTNSIIKFTYYPKLISEIRILEAKNLCMEAHYGQMYGDKPYYKHPFNVAFLLKGLCYGIDHQIIAYLHDTVEDTSLTLEKIREVFGDFIAECVDIVTDKPGINRKERKKNTYDAIKNISKKHRIALIVKVADRVDNISNGIKEKNIGLLKMYVKEHEKFRDIYYSDELGSGSPLYPILDSLIYNDVEEILRKK